MLIGTRVQTRAKPEPESPVILHRRGHERAGVWCVVGETRRRRRAGPTSRLPIAAVSGGVSLSAAIVVNKRWRRRVCVINHSPKVNAGVRLQSPEFREEEMGRKQGTGFGMWLRAIRS
ncbi:hypothetical protein HanIR_Chr14g0709191 [Helianthus annuus]|nr:hypothetical protein HanIR_Chr14g0709191 [Helianthus annuus]